MGPLHAITRTYRQAQTRYNKEYNKYNNGPCARVEPFKPGYAQKWLDKPMPRTVARIVTSSAAGLRIDVNIRPDGMARLIVIGGSVAMVAAGIRAPGGGVSPMKLR